MFTKGQIVNYYDDFHTLPTSQITIENVRDGKAIATSGSFGDMGPFLMEFDAETGEGLGLYVGTRIESIS